MKNVDYLFFYFSQQKESLHHDTPLPSSSVCQSQADLDIKQWRQTDAETTAAHLAWTQDLM